MSYLIQYVTETQIKYTAGFSKPIDVLSHFLFTIGNGVDFVEGNPVESVQFYRHIPFTEYYKDVQTPERCLQYYENVYIENRLEENYKSRKRINNFLKLTEEEQWEKALKETDEKINSIVFLTPENIFNYDFWYENLVTDLKYFPTMCISENYSRVFKINDNTEKNLLKLSKLITQVYIDFYSRCLSDSEYFNNILECISPRLRHEAQLKDIEKSLQDLYFVKSTLDLIN
jgi:hypothetical protein